MNINDNPNTENCKTQVGMIYNWLKEGNPITPLDALSEFGCMRLQARIHDIEQRYGIRVKRKYVSHRNKFGKQVSFMQYSL